jgi:hypothetical protein
VLTAAVRVPASILLHRTLSPSAKLVWICLQVERRNDPIPGSGTSPEVVRSLAASVIRNGGRLAVATVVRGLHELGEAGLLSGRPAKSQRFASLPADLLRDLRLRTQPKLLYGTLQLTEGFLEDKGYFTFAGLSAVALITAKPLRNAARVLQETGWLKVTRGSKFSLIHFTLQNDAADQGEDPIVAMGRRLARSQHYGENLMREWLNLLIDNDDYDDNARPGFLVNPFTNEKMEFDRYYPKKLAFEFHGPQHDGPTRRYPSEAAARKQQARDAIKMDICKRRGVRLIVFRRDDLSLATLRKNLKGLPLNDLDPNDPVVAHLEQLSLKHRTDS